MELRTAIRTGWFSLGPVSCWCWRKTTPNAGSRRTCAAVTDQMPYESIFGNYTSEFLCWCSRGQILLHTPGLCQTGFSKSWDIIDSVEVYDFICSNLLWSLTKFNLNLCKSSVQHMNLAIRSSCPLVMSRKVCYIRPVSLHAVDPLLWSGHVFGNLK